jgi:hypothetical protein
MHNLVKIILMALKDALIAELKHESSIDKKNVGESSNG